jgi:IS30 family transposase
MDHHPHATDNAVDQTDQELFIFTVSDEELEKAVGGTAWAQTYRGKEMADHKSFTIATNVQVYFCDPRSPWQRGSNENTNGLLRQYFPRQTDLSRFSQAYLNRIALRLNQRPRKTLGFETPADRLRAVLQ